MNAWRTMRLEECCNIVSGGTPNTLVASYWNGDICWVTPKDLSDLDGPLIGDTPRKITRSGLEACSASILPAGSVLFSSRAPIGHVAITTVPMATNQGFKSMVPDSRFVWAQYLYHWLRCNRSYLEGLGNGATFKEVSKAVVSRIEIPAPPLAEQRRIASILDQADALRAKRRAALAQLEGLAQAVFENTFLPSEEWPEATLGDLAISVRTGPFGSQLLHSEFVEYGIAVLGIDNAVKNDFEWAERRFVTEGKYRELARYRVYPRDIIVTIMGTCGRAAIVPDDIPLAITTKHLCSITLDETRCLPEYLQACLLRHPAVLRQLGATARGAVMPGLNMGLIKQTKIPLPPIELQMGFASLQRQIRLSRSNFDRSKNEIDSLFASLQHRAFRGEL